MPTISMFYGILVRMYAESGGQHNAPHLHAAVGGQEVVVALDGTVLEGEIPKAKMHLLTAWMEIHRDELYANWQLLCDGEGAYKIEPLK